MDPAIFALADVGAGQLLAVAAAAFVLSVVGGLTGYGVGLILPAVIAPIVGVAAVVPVMSVAMFLTNGSRVIAFRHHLNRPAVVAVMLTAVPAALVGAQIYTSLPERAIALLLGGFLVASVPLGRWVKRRRFVLGPTGLSTIGAGYGLLAGGMTGTGMLLIAALMAAGVEGAALVATDAAVSVTINLLKMIVFGRAAALDLELFAAGALIGACTVPGAFVARRLLRIIPVHVHVWIMELLVVIGGLSLVWRGL